MSTSLKTAVPWSLFFSELIGTALLLLGGLSLVIFIFGAGSPVAQWIPQESARRPVCGFLFGGLGALIALSPVGKVSGAHINPVVTLAFRLLGKLDLKTTLSCISGQLAGAVVGCIPLLLWGTMGESVSFGATLPGANVTLQTAFWGEVLTTFAMITLLCTFLGFRHLRPFTPALFPPLYAFMVWLEAPISGTSTNPARTLGPAILSGEWRGGWIYWAGPVVGALLASIVCSAFARRITSAKLYYFDTQEDRLFRRAPSNRERITP